MFRQLVVLTLVLPLIVGSAAAQQPRKQDLFQAGEDGYALFRIPGVVVTKRGTVLAYCEARKSGSGDWGPIDGMLRRSRDGGETWSPAQKFIQVKGNLPVNPVAAAQKLDKPGDNTVNNIVAIADHQTGDVHLLYCLEYMRCFYKRSTDDGATWTEPVEITDIFEGFRQAYDWKVIATGPGHGIQLTRGKHRGRLIVPVWLSLGTGGHAHRPSVTATVYSDDHGQTWHAGEIALPNTKEFVNPNETVAVELSDGSVLLNARSESKVHRRLVTVSSNGSSDWSPPRFDDALWEPICMGSIARVRFPQGDKSGLIAFANPRNLIRATGQPANGKPAVRKNVTVQLSKDEGATWPHRRTLEAGFSGYSDLAVLGDGTILCFYERGTTDGKNHYRPTRLTLAKFRPAWLLE